MPHRRGVRTPETDSLPARHCERREYVPQACPGCGPPWKLCRGGATSRRCHAVLPADGPFASGIAPGHRPERLPPAEERVRTFGCALPVLGTARGTSCLAHVLLISGCRVSKTTCAQVSRKHSFAVGRAGDSHGRAIDRRVQHGRPGALQGGRPAGCRSPHPAHRRCARVQRDWCALSVANALQPQHAKSAVVLASRLAELLAPVLRAIL